MLTLSLICMASFHASESSMGIQWDGSSLALKLPELQFLGFTSPGKSKRVFKCEDTYLEMYFVFII